MCHSAFLISSVLDKVLNVSFANPLCHVVEHEALVSADGKVLVVVFPGGKEQKLSALAGFHALSAGLGKVCEAVLLKDDEGQALRKGGSHHLLLALRDARGYQHRSAASLREPPCLLLGYLIVCETTGALYLQAHGALEQEAVTDGGKLHIANRQPPLHAEEVGALALHQEAAGIILQVVEPSLQLPLPQQQLVVEATGKEQAVGAVLGRALPLPSCLLPLQSCLLRLSRNVLNIGEQPAVMAVAASLEAPDDAAKVALHLLSDEQDAVQMVGHHLNGEDFHLRVIAGDAQPLCLHTPAQLRQLHAGSFRRAFWRFASPCDTAE